MTIPLLHFPILVSIKIVKELDIIDLANLLQLSTRSANLVKITKIHIKLTVCRDSLQFEMINDPVKKVDVSLAHRNATTPNERMLPFKPVSNETSKTRQEHTIDEYKRMMNNFVDIFIVESVSFNLDNAKFHLAYCFLEYARRVGLKFGNVEIELLREKDGDYQKLLTVCSDAFELIVNVYQRKKFIFNGFDQFKMNWCSIRCLDTINWITADNVCALFSCYYANVYYINWKSVDFNKLLKFWIESDGELKFLKLANREALSLRIVMNGINHTERVPDEMFEVQRADGVRANVIFDRENHFKLEVINV